MSLSFIEDHHQGLQNISVRLFVTSPFFSMSSLENSGISNFGGAYNELLISFTHTHILHQDLIIQIKHSCIAAGYSQLRYRGAYKRPIYTTEKGMSFYLIGSLVGPQPVGRVPMQQPIHQLPCRQADLKTQTDLTSPT